MDADDLKSVPLFAGLAKRDRKLVARFADQVQVPAGRVLTDEGGSSLEFFVILTGTASVQRGGHEIARLGPGQFFGEIGVLTHSPRTATVTAATPMDLVVLFSQNFAAIEDQIGEVHKLVGRAMAERLNANKS